MQFYYLQEYINTIYYLMDNQLNKRIWKDHIIHHRMILVWYNNLLHINDFLQTYNKHKYHKYLDKQIIHQYIYVLHHQLSYIHLHYILFHFNIFSNHLFISTLYHHNNLHNMFHFM